MKKITSVLLLCSMLTTILFTGCVGENGTTSNENSSNSSKITTTTTTTKDTTTEKETTTTDKNTKPKETDTKETTTTVKTTTKVTSTAKPSNDNGIFQIKGDTLTYLKKNYTIIQVDGGNRNGSRKANVAVDIGFGDRKYYGLTNTHGQLVYVLAEKVILQNDDTEPVNSEGRYYDDEAYVPGTEHKDLDQGHIIADSMGGVANAYNITPQDSTLNRHGDQAYMEKSIRDAGGCENFIATITYPNTSTQTPNHYKYVYTLRGNVITDSFDNVNPDDYNKENGVDGSGDKKPSSGNSNQGGSEDLSKVDTNGNGTVTIAEAKAAGFAMPITKDHWLYKYMKDSDGDGKVGESN